MVKKCIKTDIDKTQLEVSKFNSKASNDGIVTKVFKLSGNGLKVAKINNDMSEEEAEWIVKNVKSLGDQDVVFAGLVGNHNMFEFGVK